MDKKLKKSKDSKASKKVKKKKKIKKKDKKSKKAKKDKSKRFYFDSNQTQEDRQREFEKRYEPFQKTRDPGEPKPWDRQVAKLNDEEAQLKQEIQVFTKKIQNIEYKFYKDDKRTVKYAQNNSINPVMIEIYVNDRMGRKERIKCCPSDTIRDLKKLVAAKTGTRWERIKLQKGFSVYKDNITLDDYEIKHGFGFEMYYN